MDEPQRTPEAGRPAAPADTGQEPYGTGVPGPGGPPAGMGADGPTGPGPLTTPGGLSSTDPVAPLPPMDPITTGSPAGLGTQAPGAGSGTAGGGSTGGDAKAKADEAAAGAAEVKDHAVEQAGALKEEAAAQVRDVAGEARQHLGSVATTATTQLKEQAGEQATRVGGGMEGIAQQLTAMAQGSDQQGVVPDLIGSLGDQLGDLATRLQQGSLDDVIDDVRRFARRRPGMFLLAAAGAGFAASRVARMTDISPSELRPQMGGDTGDGVSSGSTGSGSSGSGTPSDLGTSIGSSGAEDSIVPGRVEPVPPMASGTSAGGQPGPGALR